MAAVDRRQQRSEGLRVAVRVRLGVARTTVGGRHGDALVVCVTARPAGVRRPRLFCGQWQRRSACRGGMSRW